MPEQLQKIVQPIKSRWDALTKDQKIKLAIAIAVVLIALVLTLYFLLRTDYEVLYDNRDVDTLYQYEEVLRDAGIPVRTINNGTGLEVDKNQIIAARRAVSSSTAITGDRFTFADALDYNGMGTTSDTSRRMFIKASEDQLNEQLAQFTDVNTAAVTLVIPEAMRLFVTDDEESSASVILNVNRELLPSEGESMAAYLASSVENLDMENITITDQEYRIVYSGMKEEAARSVEGSLAEVKSIENDSITNNLRSAFSRQFPDVVVVPNLIYNDVSMLQEIRDEYFLPDDSETGLPSTEITSSFSGENVSPDDAPGTDTNNMEQQEYQTGTSGESSFEQEERNVERLYNHIQQTISHGAGSYLRDQSTLAIFLYRYHTHFQSVMMQDDPEYSDDDWAAFQANTIERNITDEDGNVELYRLQASTATGIPVENISVSVWELPAFVSFTETPVDIPLIIALSLLGLLLLMLAYALIRRQKLVEEEEETEPELSVEDLLVSTQLEEAKEEAEKLEEIDYAKESEIKKQIEKFVNEKPEAVAALLRNWLNTEEW